MRTELVSASHPKLNADFSRGIRARLSIERLGLTPTGWRHTAGQRFDRWREHSRHRQPVACPQIA
jgi:hypothetical protein